MVRVALAVTIAGLLALSAPAHAFQVRARGVQQDSLTEKRKELQVVLLRQRAIAQEIRRTNDAFKRAGSEPEREVVRVKLTDLHDRMARTLTELEMVKAHIQSLCMSRPGPDGWIGINFNADVEVTTSPNATRFEFGKRYPVIVSVEPGSPAQKAGLVAGDELVTIDGRDMISVSMDVAALLKPGAQLPVRVRRDGALRTITVLVEPKPQGFAPCPWVDVAVAPIPLAMEEKMLVRPEPNGFGFVITTDSGKVLARTRKVQPEALPRGAEVMTPVLPPTPYTHRFQPGLPSANATLLGAVLIPPNVDLREGLEIEDGFLVLHVYPGTVAFDAGLRAGDVITSVNGRKPRTIRELIKALDEAGDGASLLRVASRRSAKPRVVRLSPN